MNIVSARKAYEFVNVIDVDSKGRVTKAVVPGHKGRSYEVKINRKGNSVLASCHCKSDNSDCKGNSSGVCYHVGAALLLSASKLFPKVKVAFCNSKSDAQKLVNIAGKMFSLYSTQSEKQIWVVVVQVLDSSKLIC